MLHHIHHACSSTSPLLLVLHRNHLPRRLHHIYRRGTRPPKQHLRLLRPAFSSALGSSPTGPA
uniref:Uncharacterized protein n=1 Tax=Arundo donax TaxID=35708 RepID=A0A0A9CJ24_ARUDO